MRILLVEDELKIATALKKGLEQEAFAVDVYTNGKDGLASALHDAYDVVILDRMLPDIEDGLVICQKMRENKITTPVLVLTAKQQIHERVRGLDTGADDYLAKPFAFEELLARVRALLRRPTEQLEAILSIGDLRLDPLNLHVKRAGKTVDLSPKEFALLEYLMRHPGRVISKDTLIAHVWDYDADILPNTVEVYIGYLRTKLEKPFKGPPVIQTVRGFGYRIGEA